MSTKINQLKNNLKIISDIKMFGKHQFGEVVTKYYFALY